MEVRCFRCGRLVSDEGAMIRPAGRGVNRRNRAFCPACFEEQEKEEKGNGPLVVGGLVVLVAALIGAFLILRR